MLCEPKSKVNLLGSSMLFGVVIGFLFVPWLSDIYGRRYPILVTMIIGFIT
jgi:MFS family permease